jgi:hypothetical protein
MTCDWLARSQEFGTGLRSWIEEEAIKRYNIKTDSEEYKWISTCVDMLLQDPFSQEVKPEKPEKKSRKKAAKAP